MACALAFPDIGTLKAHYKEDLHQCNLQRKVQGLLPLGAEDFARRAAELSAPEVSKSTKGRGKGKGKATDPSAPADGEARWGRAM